VSWAALSSAVPTPSAGRTDIEAREGLALQNLGVQERHVNEEHPVRFSAEYPDRPLNRVTTASRIFTDAKHDLTLAPLIKWLLAIPHYIDPSIR
jgi:hypothetical protein